jgi:hypothetical protein
MPITINGTGTITGISAGGLPDAIITQPELATGVGGTGPAFSAYVNGSQTVSSGTATKVQFNTETFDTANCFDNSTNYRFTPNVAGYYQFTTQIQVGTSYTAGDVSIRKNGTTNHFGLYTTFSGIAANAGYPASVLLYMNGTTDYVEVYITFATTQLINTGGNWSFFQGFLARAA